jgi:tetratricopeptide (TPR) repeat protein
MWLFRKRKKIEKDSIVGELWECQFSQKNKNRFELEDNKSLKTEIRDESLSLTAKKQNLFVWSVNNFYRYKDFVLDCLISIDMDNGHSAAGILFRYTDKLNYYYLMVSEDGFFRMDVVFNGTPRVLIPWTSCNLESPGEIRIRIIVHGFSIALFLDDIWIGEIDDDTIDAGYIAFGGQNFSIKEAACFSLSRIKIESRAVEVEISYHSQVKNGIIPAENRKKLAQRLFDSGQYGAVLIQIKKISKENPTDAELSFLLAKSLGMLCSYDEALIALDSCVELSGKYNKDVVIEKSGLLYRMNKLLDLRDFMNSHPDVLNEESFLLNLMGNTEDGLGRFDIAVDFYRRACSMEPGNGVFRLNIARTLEKSGYTESSFEFYNEAALCFFRDENYDELTHVLSSMSRIKPDNREGRILEGKVLFDEGRLEEAFLIFQRLVKEGLEDTSVDFLYGIILREKGHREDALALFKSSAEKEEEYYPYWFRYAETMYLMGLSAGDIALKAIDLEPDNPWAHNLYGLILLSENRGEEAKLRLSKALELEENSIDILINYSDAVASVDGIEAALSLFKGGSEVPSAQNQLGNLLYDTGDYEKAENSYRKAVAGDSSNRNYKENLASALLKQDYILAAEEILSGLMENYQTSATLEMIAQVAFRKGEYKRADTSFIEAIKLEPGNFRILLNYGDFLFTRLDYKGAGEIAERVLSMPDVDGALVRKNESDDARHLLLKVKTALNDKHECSNCSRTWWVSKNIPVIDVVRLHGEPDGESPAGKCINCGKVYCVKCVIDHIRDSRFVCPDCNEYLKLSENYLKYLAMEYANR